jgi:hypothetical protein
MMTKRMKTMYLLEKKINDKRPSVLFLVLFQKPIEAER